MISDLKPDRTWHSAKQYRPASKEPLSQSLQKFPDDPAIHPHTIRARSSWDKAFLDMGYLRRDEGFDEGLYVDPASAAAQVLQ